MNQTKFYSLLLFLIFLVFSSNYSFAQTTDAGKVFSKLEADKLFGPVYNSVKIPTSIFESLISKCGDFMMFRFEGSDLYILDSKKRVLFSTSGTSKTFSMTDVMKYYSITVIKELLSKGQNSSITIESREGVMSVTDGDYTMEKAFACPPDCPTDPLP